MQSVWVVFLGESQNFRCAADKIQCFWSQFQNFLCVANQIQFFCSQLYFRCAADQTSAFVRNYIFAARLNKIQWFSSQLQKFSLRSWTTFAQCELFLLTNSKMFHCAAEQNTVNLSCFCWKFQSFAARLNKGNLIWVAFVGKFQNLGCAAEQNTVN
jgi:hypothetical protein